MARVYSCSAVGLFELYIFGNRKRLANPGWDTIRFVVDFFTGNLRLLGVFAKYSIPIALILVGAIILYKNKNSMTNIMPKMVGKTNMKETTVFNQFSINA